MAKENNTIQTETHMSEILLMENHKEMVNIIGLKINPHIEEISRMD